APGGRIARWRCPRPGGTVAAISPTTTENRVTRLLPWLAPAVAAALCLTPATPAADPDAPLVLTLRSRAAAPGQPPATPTERTVSWDPKATAIVVCDMWDQHWCKSAAARVGELAGPTNEMLKAARAKGAFVIHAPSTCTAFYKGTPQRERARTAPFARAPLPL